MNIKTRLENVKKGLNKLREAYNESSVGPPRTILDDIQEFFSDWLKYGVNGLLIGSFIGIIISFFTPSSERNEVIEPFIYGGFVAGIIIGYIYKIYHTLKKHGYISSNVIRTAKNLIGGSRK